MVTGQLLVMTAIRIRETRFVAPFCNATLFFAFLYGMVVFGEIPDLRVFPDAGAIVSSGIAITLQGAREARLRRAG